MNPSLQHPRGNSDKTHQDGKAHESDKKKVLKLFNSEKHFPFWEQSFPNLTVAFTDTLSQKVFFSSLIFHSSNHVHGQGEGKGSDKRNIALNLPSGRNLIIK